MTRPTAALLLALSALSPIACTGPGLRDTASPSLWRIRSPEGAGRGTAYLLGSVHVGPTQGWRYPAAVSDAFTESETLVVEFDPLGVSDAESAAVFERGFLPAGQSITDLLAPETWRLCQPHLASAGIPETQAMRMKPWLLALMLGQAAIERLGYEADQGVDLDFLRRARASKPIVELESMEFQIGLFDGMNARLQELMLIDTLLSLDEISSFLGELMDSWRRGDESNLSSLLQHGLAERPELQPFYDIVFKQRNVSMSEQIEALVRAGGTHFVVVGALHVLGESGIVAALGRRGFGTERIDTH